jgi:aerobic-type carbon monoxide dehydrogenase small subunit (CoxS/CutS family)
MNDDPTNSDKAGSQISRRAFIKSAGAAAVVAGIGTIRKPPASAAGSVEVPAVTGDGVAEQLGPEAVTLELNINGAVRQITVEPRVTLLEALRDHLGLYGTKLVCDREACGACTVHLDDSPVTSCMILVTDARGHRVTTIEGLGSGAGMHPIQHAFVENDALQCGFCTPGMIMSVAAALNRNPNADLDEIKRSVSGNICRCGTYPHVFKAALAAATHLHGASQSKA